MSFITLGDKTFEKYISETEIEGAIDGLSAKINADYEGDIPVFIVTLNGAIFFAVDLLRRLTIDLEVSCIKLASYKGTAQSDCVKNLIGLTESLKGRRVVIVEDIVDTGNTYEHIMKMLQKEDAKDIRIATMTFKPDAYTKTFPIHYAALTIPSKFVVGRGLDYNGLGRNYRDIYQIVTP